MSKQLRPYSCPPIRTMGKRTLILPVLLIGLGAGWLLTALGIGPGIDWVWTLGLAAIGVLTFAVSGLDKVSIVVGPLFVSASFLSLFRQRGRLPIDVELPLLVILAGLLLLVARLSFVSPPHWLVSSQGDSD